MAKYPVCALVSADGHKQGKAVNWQFGQNASKFAAWRGGSPVNWIRLADRDRATPSPVSWRPHAHRRLGLNWRIITLVVTALAVPGSFVAAPYPEELLLQHIPTLVGLGMLAVAIGKFRPSRLSFVCCVAFLWLHVIGARWIYSFVPYDELAFAITGRSLSDAFGWQRNHYDRLVHLASGVLGVPPIAEFLRTRCQVLPVASAALAIACVLAIGAMYEVLEWQIAVTLSPEMAESYNGQQGDVWDPQKDLALAWLGATASAIWIGWRWKSD